MIPDAEAAAPEWAERLRSWQQGDYCLDVRQVVVVDGIENGDLLPAAGDALGFAVITQTCDIVNWGPAKEWVVVAPLVEASERLIDNVRRGTTPAFAPLERPPSPEVVVDLNQAMTLHKSLLASLTRVAGFETDAARSRFADAIGRKYSRFAFPDPFADNVLRALRTKLHKSHGKDSEQGRTYASIDFIRVVAAPSWDSRDIRVGFRFVLAPEFRRKEDRAVMSGVLGKLLAGIDWPEGFQPEDPPFTLMTVEEMTAAEWLGSQEVDLNFISISKPAV
ncbi:hypothetical protein RFN28_15400 [Mesorhizobium sp. VK24D]|uniref:Uncharacterized protein n=1 Tax=Mesorhizobium album TaxID=3072314 RepID=A0ABU4Y0M9_9HYPH|nr:hypothetical protein [Mesorhizobium sp. VK24D]MDX8479858.1 hypothetical protein [Mesorhizobium sp. VK24D]